MCYKSHSDLASRQSARSSSSSSSSFKEYKKVIYFSKKPHTPILGGRG